MKKFSFLIVIILLAVGGYFSWWVTAISPVDISDKQTKLFTIEPGTGIREIANELKSEGIIRDSVAFFLLIKQLRLENKIQAGEFYLSPSQSATQVADALQVGTFDNRITIPEGHRAEQIAQTLEKNFPNYQSSWIQELKQHEGYLFPDTYAFAKDADIDDIIATMTNTFEEKYATVQGPRLQNYTKDEIVTIASLVEREARFAEDRPLVASVIFNRLEIDMGLQIDATVQYLLGYQPQEKTWWKRHLTYEDLQIDSPYNTYQTPGLPPTPIANPGLDVLNAVANAPDTAYLYYISDSTGRNHYATTLAQHNANIKRFGLE